MSIVIRGARSAELPAVYDLLEQAFPEAAREFFVKQTEADSTFRLRHGRVAVIEFRMDSPDGPPKDARIAPERVKAELKSAGYAFVQEHGFLPTQYFLVFRPDRS